MPAMKIATNFGKPIGQPDTHHSKCASCGCVEGQFVRVDNELTVGVGAAAEVALARGWTFTLEGGWRCPAC